MGGQLLFNKTAGTEAELQFNKKKLTITAKICAGSPGSRIQTFVFHATVIQRSLNYRGETVWWFRLLLLKGPLKMTLKIELF